MENARYKARKRLSVSTLRSRMSTTTLVNITRLQSRQGSDMEENGRFSYQTSFSHPCGTFQPLVLMLS